MIKVIDRTLSQLENIELVDGEMLLEMCNLLVQVGVDYIELSVPILEKIGQLPKEGHYILKIDSPKQIEAYPGFDKYVYKGEAINAFPIEVTHEVEVTNLEQLEKIESQLEESSSNKKSEKRIVRLVGLDNLMHEEYESKIQKLIRTSGKTIEFCPKDKYFCATALAIEWLMHGGTSVAVSFNGIGGYAKLEEVLIGIKVIMHKKMSMDLRMMPRISVLYEKLTQRHINYNKAVVGKNIFNVEAGVQLEVGKKQGLGYEPYDPVEVGKVRRLVIGKHSGTGAIKLKLKEKGVHVPDKVVKQLVEDVKTISMDKGRSLTDREFLHLVKEVVISEA